MKEEKRLENSKIKLYIKDIVLSIMIMAITIAIQLITGQNNVFAETKLKNPRIVKNDSMEAGQKVTWDCIYFGSYPQTEIVDKAETSGVYGRKWATKEDYEINNKIYTKLKKATDWDSNGDIVIDGNKYRRINTQDIVYVPENEYMDAFTWKDKLSYHYFRYEKIKWRILKVNNNEVFLLADKVLDDQKYNEQYTDITWEQSSIRKWLNGDDNVNKNFIQSAFSVEERKAIKDTTVKNENNIKYGTVGGEETIDKIFFLSEAEAITDSYGFMSDYNAFDNARESRSSTYAKAMGVASENMNSDKEKTGNCTWWLRSPGGRSDHAIMIGEHGYGYVCNWGDLVDSNITGVRPVLNLNLSSSNLWSYAGTVSSDETVNENSTSKKGFCQNNKYVKQLDPENLLQNINIDGGKISSPQMKILEKMFLY